MIPDAESLKLVFATNHKWSEWAAIAVVIGLLGDILVIFLFSKDKPRSETWLAFSCTLIIALGVYGEYIFGSKAAQAADQLQQMSDQKVAELILKADAARKDAELAKATAKGFEARIAEAQARAADAIKVAEQEHLARVTIEGTVAWRRITQVKRSEIAVRLKRFSGQYTAVWFQSGNAEGGTFASDIGLTLVAATWKVEEPRSMLTMGTGNVATGVTIQSTGDEASRNASDAIVRELLALGFDAVISSRIESRPMPMVFVNVELRPEGLQGNAKLAAKGKP